MQHLRSHREAALLQPEATQVATFAAFGHRLAAQADEEDEEMYKTLAKTLAVQVIIPPFHIAHPSPTPSGWCDPASQWCDPSPLRAGLLADGRLGAPQAPLRSGGALVARRVARRVVVCAAHAARAGRLYRQWWWRWWWW